MSKKILLMFMLFFVGIIRVNAEDIYYSNENGVSFTKKQYDFFSKMYYEEVKRIDIKHLDNICKAFDCEISELLEYIPDKKN